MSKPPVDPRTAEMIRVTKNCVDEQIEAVAKAVCEDGDIEGAMRELAELTKRLAILETRGVWHSAVMGPLQVSTPRPPSLPSSD
jgi:hypothetical protein